MKSSDVLLAFSKVMMLTRGSDTANDKEYETNWKEDIRKYVNRRQQLNNQLNSLPPLIEIPYKGEEECLHRPSNE